MASKASIKNLSGVEKSKRKPSQIPRALSLMRKGMAFMQQWSSPKASQEKQPNSNFVRPIHPMKWEEIHNGQQSSSPSFGKQDTQPSKPTRTPKAAKLVCNSKKVTYKPSPYSYSVKKPSQQSRIPVRRCQSVTPVTERIALLESEEMDLMERLRIVRHRLENLRVLRTNQVFVDRMNEASNQKKMPKIEEEPYSSPSVAYVRPLRPRGFSVNGDIQRSP